VFDPAPTGVAIPWRYLVVLLALTIAAIAAAAASTIRATRHIPIETLRDL
jgi:putative ABC transport system permease protein